VIVDAWRHNIRSKTLLRVSSIGIIENDLIKTVRTFSGIRVVGELMT
jgi:hypothetical protein